MQCYLIRKLLVKKLEHTVAFELNICLQYRNYHNFEDLPTTLLFYY
jgi:hypothetical protein